MKFAFVGLLLITIHFVYRIKIKPLDSYTIPMYSIYYITIILILSYFVLFKYIINKDFHNYLNKFISNFTIIFILFFLSAGFNDLFKLSQTIGNDIIKYDIKVLDSRSNGMKSSFNKLNSLVDGRKGIMALENTFIGAFLDIPIDSIYDVQEIPLFGTLEDSIYDGLNPNRIDTILISKSLTTQKQYENRYVNYIKPYVNKLISMGAIEYKIPNYGIAIIYDPFISKQKIQL